MLQSFSQRMHVIFSCESILRSQGISLQTVVRKYFQCGCTSYFYAFLDKSDLCGCIMISQVNQLCTEREFSCSVHFNSTAWTRSLISTVTRLLQQHRVCQVNYWPPSFPLKRVYVFSCIQYPLNYLWSSKIKYLWADWMDWFSLWMTKFPSFSNFLHMHLWRMRLQVQRGSGWAISQQDNQAVWKHLALDCRVCKLFYISPSSSRGRCLSQSKWLSRTPSEPPRLPR